jgi:starch-binding outer membrane protein, SusD/RagB family
MTMSFALYKGGRAGGALALAASLTLLSACDVKKELLEPQQPGVISPSSVNSAVAADAVYVGALARWEDAVNGSNSSNNDRFWGFEALFTDEVRSSDTFSQRNDADQRNTQSNDGQLLPMYNAMQQARGRARDAINALETYDTSPAGKTHVGEMYLMMGYLEMSLNEAFCNGVPLGETVNGVPQYTAQLTNADGFKVALARFDTALTFLTGTDAATTAVKNAVLIARGRTQVDLGDFAGGAATVASVPTSYQYNFDYTQTTQDNEWWIQGPSVKRYNAGDSVDVAGTILNAIPYARLGDPRVSVVDTHTKGEDNSSEFFAVLNWGRDDPTPPLSGIDARLIEAEAKLQSGDIAGMMTILNALRTSPQVIGVFKVPAQAALPTPADKASATDLFFREKALWQFERGYRMEDLRRLVRQYGRTQDKVFPSGNFTRNGNPSGTFGTEVALPIPDVGIGSEISNPNFHGCLDKNA